MPDRTHDVDLSLFVACYNEEQGIAPTLDTVVAAAAEVGINYETVIIDDCSTDNSVAAIVDYLNGHPDRRLLWIGFVRGFEHN